MTAAVEALAERAPTHGPRGTGIRAPSSRPGGSVGGTSTDEAAAAAFGLLSDETRVAVLRQGEEDYSFTHAGERVVRLVVSGNYGDLRGMGRVCRPDGEIRLPGHGHSDVAPLTRFPEWRAEAHYAKPGCRWAREPLDLVSAAGPTVEDVETRPFGR